MEAKCSRWSEKDGGGEEKRAVVVFITVKAPPPFLLPRSLSSSFGTSPTGTGTFIYRNAST